MLRRALTLLALLTPLVAAGADAQQLYSFESDLEGWGPWTFSNAAYIDHSQTTFGATDGTMAMAVETFGGFGREVVASVSAGPRYDLFNTVAANPSAYTFDFDVTMAADSWAQVDNQGTYFLFDVFSNSDAGFTEEYNLVNATPGVAGSYVVSMPASELSLTPDSSFFQVGIGTNSDHSNSTNTVGVTYYVDNIRFTALPQYDVETLFSWETVDDPGTPLFDESLEGWQDGFSNAAYQHTRTIVTDGATDGAKALQVGSPQSGFAWGSQFVLDSTEENGDPSLQPLIDQLVDKVNDADIIALDITFPDDQFPNIPTYQTITLNIADGSDSFYQLSKQAGNPNDLAGQTVTLEFPLSAFISDGVSLTDAGGLQDGTQFRLALATNSDSATDFYLDNIRLLSAISEGLDGDYNEDGVVDAADYTVWRDNLGAAEGTLPNDPDGGVIGQAQYDTWVANFGASESASAATPTPEPVGLAFVCLFVAAGGSRRRR